MAISEQDLSKIGRVVSILMRARSLFFITGAGISADSDMPTYRGMGGLYNEIHPEEGIPIEEILSGSMFARNPALTWKYMREIAKACRGAVFNRGHQVIAEMERHFERVWVLTQNVDGFHTDAGSKNVIDIHGNLHALVCPRCHFKERVDDYLVLPELPLCPKCRGVIRPDVVLFGEMLPMDKSLQLAHVLQQGFDVLFTIGTSSAFQYIAQPVVDAREMGTPTVEINPTETEISLFVEIRLPMRAAEALDAIWTRYKAIRELE